MPLNAAGITTGVSDDAPVISVDISPNMGILLSIAKTGLYTLMKSTARSSTGLPSLSTAHDMSNLLALLVSPSPHSVVF